MIILVMFLRTFRHSARMKQPNWTSRYFFPSLIGKVLDEVFRRTFLFPNHYLLISIHKRHTSGGFTPGLCCNHQSFQGSNRRTILVITVKSRYGTHASLVSFRKQRLGHYAGGLNRSYCYRGSTIWSTSQKTRY